MYKISRDCIGDFNSSIGFAIIQAFTQMGDNLTQEQQDRLVGEKEDKYFEISFIVNGVELDFETVAKEYDRQFLRIATEKAGDIVEEYFNDSLAAVRDALEEASVAIRNKTKEI